MKTYMSIIGDKLRDLVPFVQFKKGENTHEEVLVLKINTPPKVFFTFLRLYKWYQIAQSMSQKIIVRNNCQVHPCYYELRSQN